MSGDHNQYQKERSFLDDRREDIIAMARDAGLCTWVVPPQGAVGQLEHFYALATAAERNKLAAWMRDYGYATGHGDTMEQLCDALGTEIVDSIEAEVAAEREACAELMFEIGSAKLANAIRAREQA
jgi:hypothetical protein